MRLLPHRKWYKYVLILGHCQTFNDICTEAIDTTLASVCSGVLLTHSMHLNWNLVINLSVWLIITTCILIDAHIYSSPAHSTLPGLQLLRDFACWVSCSNCNLCPRSGETRRLFLCHRVRGRHSLWTHHRVMHKPHVLQYHGPHCVDSTITVKCW